MLSQVLQLDSYLYDSDAVPLFATAALIVVMAALSLTHERGSRVAVPLFLMSIATSAWLFGFGMMYCAVEPAVALWWARAAHVGIVYIPVTALYFAARLVGLDRNLSRALSLAIVVSAVFMTLAWLSPDFVVETERRWWGPYPRHGPVGIAFVIYLAVLCTACVALFWRSFRDAPPKTAMHHRSKLFFVASLIGVVSVVDFLPMYGFDIFPFGRVTMLCLFAITTYVTWRYRLVDLTPAFVGQQITETMTDALVVMDRDGYIRLTNPAACRVFGLSEQSMVGGKVGDVLGEALVPPLEELLSGGSIRERELTISRVNGQQLMVSLNASVMRDRYRDPVAFVFNVRDISYRKRAEQRIRQLAYYDDLTALPNRAKFNEHLQHCLRVADAENIAVTTLFLDLDRFKRINDTLGHSAGDELLRQVAERLRGCIRDSDLLASAERAGASSFVARLGGDEFIICLFDIANPDVDGVAQRILHAIAEPFGLGQHEVFVSGSLGVSRYPEDGRDVQALLKNADTAMYHAKEAGRNNYKYYDTSMNATTVERLAIEADLRKALDRDELALVYQPQFDQASGKIIGSEALLRWHHPLRGTVPPADFVPLAEEIGLIPSIGAWVLEKACRQTAAWHRAGHGALSVAVNLSERQFRRENLLQIVARALQSSRLPPQCLDLELTESIIMHQADATIETLEALKLMGIKISVDDFGTGYSSLSYLKRFPIDVLKVDESFVRDAATDPDDAAITTAIIAMARSLHIDVIAEGVETPAQMEFLARHGCTKMQGYMLGRPMPAAQFEQLLEHTRARQTPAGAGRTDRSIVPFPRG